MKTILQKSLLGLIITLGFFLCFGSASAQSGTWTFASSSGLETTAENIGYVGAPPTIEMILGQSIKTILALLGVIFLGLIIYGGITWMTAGGNDESVNKAKKIIQESAIGLIVVIIAYAAAFFVLNYFGQDTLN